MEKRIRIESIVKNRKYKFPGRKDVDYEIHLPRERQKGIKQKWSRQYEELEKIVNEWDPAGLISGGAPTYEYNCLSTQILFLLHEGKDTVKIQEFILEKLDEHFGYGLKNISKEYHETFIKRCNEATLEIVGWFKRHVRAIRQVIKRLFKQN